MGKWFYWNDFIPIMEIIAFIFFISKHFEIFFSSIIVFTFGQGSSEWTLVALESASRSQATLALSFVISSDPARSSSSKVPSRLERFDVVDKSEGSSEEGGTLLIPSSTDRTIARLLRFWKIRNLAYILYIFGSNIISWCSIISSQIIHNKLKIIFSRSTACKGGWVSYVLKK